jgi:internalin A
LGEPWSEKWSPPKNADEIWMLNLFECNVTNASLREVAALKKLRSLNLVGTHVTEPGLIELPGLTQLSSLAVNQNLVTDRLLKRFADANRLHVLEIIVDEIGWPQPKSGAEVRSINLSSTSVTDASLKELRRLKGLIKLQLNEMQVTDAALEVLAEINLLHTLDRATGESEKRPKNTNEIQALNLQKCNVSDASLKVLAELQSLRALDLRDTRVTEAGLMRWRAAMPNCKIIH